MTSKFENATDEELLRILEFQPGDSEARVWAKLELEIRKDRRQFWRKDIIAWIALVLSVCSLLLNGYRMANEEGAKGLTTRCSDPLNSSQRPLGPSG